MDAILGTVVGNLAAVMLATIAVVFTVDKFAFNDRLPMLKGFRKVLLPLLATVIGSLMYWLVNPDVDLKPITFYGLLLGGFTSTSYKVLKEGYEVAVEKFVKS